MRSLSRPPLRLMPNLLSSRRTAALVAVLLAALAGTAATAQTGATLVGTVTDTEGETLPGVSVYLSGTTRGVA